MYNINIIKDKEKQIQKVLKNNSKVQITIYESLNLMYNINIIKVKETT